MLLSTVENLTKEGKVCLGRYYLQTKYKSFVRWTRYYREDNRRTTRRR